MDRARSWPGASPGGERSYGRACSAAASSRGLSTSWVGVKERITFYSWHLRFILLALTLLRQRLAVGRRDAHERVGDDGRSLVSSGRSPASIATIPK
jgi:hypothetical protein